MQVRIAFFVGCLTDFAQGGIFAVFPKESGQTATANLQRDQFAPIQSLGNRRFQRGKRFYNTGRGRWSNDIDPRVRRFPTRASRS